MAKQPTNLGQGIPRLGGELITRLNNIDPGLGTLLASEINYRTGILSSRVAATAGHAGTVVIAPQKRTSSGSKPPAMKIQGTVVGEGAQSGDEFVTLAQVRALFTCDRFAGHPSGFPGWFEDCVEQEAAIAAASVVGIIPWFFGYSFYPPNAADTVRVDGGTSNRINIWPMSIPAPARISHTVFNLPTFDGTVIESSVGFALYNGDRELVADTGGFSINQDPTHYKVGVQVQALRQGTVDLPAGGYYFCYFANQCFNIYMWRRNFPVMQIWNESSFGPVVSGWQGIDGLGTLGDAAFPDSLPAPIGTSAIGQDVPIVLFALNGFGV